MRPTGMGYATHVRKLCNAHVQTRILLPTGVRCPNFVYGFDGCCFYGVGPCSTTGGSARVYLSRILIMSLCDCDTTFPFAEVGGGGE